MQDAKLTLTEAWDKVFPKSELVDHEKVTFHNRYGITLAADLYKPKGAEGKLAAIAVSGPFGAVKEQSSGLYAQTMAERGFLTIAFINQPILSMAGEIDNPVLIIHGEKAHSRYFSEGAFKLLKGDNKELMIIPGANHCDLYDGGEGDYIPFDKLQDFFEKGLA